MDIRSLIHGAIKCTGGEIIETWAKESDNFGPVLNIVVTTRKGHFFRHTKEYKEGEKLEDVVSGAYELFARFLLEKVFQYADVQVDVHKNLTHGT